MSPLLFFTVAELANHRSKRKERWLENQKNPTTTATGSACGSRFLQGGAGALQDYELLELLLTFAIPCSDVKPLAKKLIAHFGSFTRVFDATPEAIMEVTGLKEYSAVLMPPGEGLRRILSEGRGPGPATESPP